MPWLPLAPVEIELALQILLCADAVVVIGIRGKELPLALRTGSQRRDFIHILQDDETAFCHVPISNAAFEFCPSELGTRGAVDLPRSAAKLQNAAE